MITRIFIGIISLVIALVTPFYFESILFFSVANIGLGWVITTILIRLIVILFLTIVLVQIFSFFVRLKKIKTWIVFLIAIAPGFGISFISPIYETDYGLRNDDFPLNNQAVLSDSTGVDIVPKNGYAVCAFFTTTCPHCMAASQKLGINIEGGQKTPVYTFFPGTLEDTENFLKVNNGSKFQYFLIDNADLFLNTSGGVFPSIFVINSKGETEYHWNGDEMNYSALDYLKSLEN